MKSMRFLTNYTRNICKRALSLTLAVILLLSIGVSALAIKGSYSTLGTNKALGSPLLNAGAVSDNWNKYETIVWGIFLSNFCVPFLDDYESAFNLGSPHGSKGSGLKALSFGTGNDVNNNKTIQTLTKYAIDNQISAATPIEVSYNAMAAGKIVSENLFTSGTTGDAGGTTVPSTPEAGGEMIAKIKRQAVLRDLFFDKQIKESDADTDINNNTWAAFTVGYGDATADFWNRMREGAGKNLYKNLGLNLGEQAENTGVNVYTSVYLVFECENYRDMIGVNLANIPTFAVKGQNKAYEVVLDYRNAFDIEMMSAAIALALSGDHKADVDAFFNTSTLDEPLYFDNYGNITVKSGGRYKIIIPASANQYLTASPSINMVNSLIFNAGNSSTSPDTLISSAGQAELKKTFGANASNIVTGMSGALYGIASLQINKTIGNFGGTAKSMQEIFRNMTGGVDKTVDIYSGSSAFSNESARTGGGGCVLFYDTDTLVATDALKNDTMYEYAKGGYVNIAREDIPETAIEEVDYGKLLTRLYDLDINDESNTVPFKIEPINIGETMFAGVTDEAKKNMIMGTVSVSSSLINTSETNGKVPRLTKLKNFSGGEDIELFGKEIIVPVQAQDGIGDNGKYNQWEVFRRLHNYMYDVYKGKITTSPAGDVDKEALVRALGDTKSNRELFNKIISGGKKVDKYEAFSDFAIGFIANSKNLYDVKDTGKLNKLVKNGTWSGITDMITFNKDMKNIDGGKVGDVLKKKFEQQTDTATFWGTKFDGGGANETRMDYAFGRTTKVYNTSDVLSKVADIMGIREGTDFGVYASNIYLTYIDWYGLRKDLASGKYISDLNMNIYNDNQVITNISDVADVKSKEDKQAEIMDYTYLMLHPTEGRAYRSKIAMSNLADAVYEQYQRLVYGQASDYGYSGVTTRNNSGFLSVENYSENFMTAWFMNNYVTIAIYLIAIGIVLVIIISVLKKRKLSWAFLGIVIVINVVLILPSTGEIVPYIGNNVVQSLFDDKMTYWSLSEQITNATMERDAVDGDLGMRVSGEKMSPTEMQQVVGLTKQVKSLYLDRYLSVKQDISNKVTNTDKSNYDEIQSLTSARWMLPMIMRQFSADDGSANYVTVALGDKMDNASNMYWYYKPSDADYVKTVTAKNITNNTVPAKYDPEKTNSLAGYTGMLSKWGGYIPPDTSSAANGKPKNDYRSIGYTNNPDIKERPHEYFYMIDNEALNGINANIKRGDTSDISFDKWGENFAESLKNALTTNGGIEKMQIASQSIQEKASGYDMSDRATVDQTFGFLWNTESPTQYFYESVKDNFESNYNLGSIVGDLQGSFKKDPDTGEKYRHSFMHDENTHGIRDLADLECMFNNVIPYMYSMQVAAGGFDGKSGVFGEELIKDYSVYNKNQISWLFRSNWVTKIVENRDYNSPSAIKYVDTATGKIEKSEVDNMMFPWCYRDRDMIFSEAQMLAMGLDESALTLVELKCVETNREIEKQWTLMLNYVSQPGITKEVILRQMGIDATMIFNKQFSPVGLSSAVYSVYPQSLDLRSISFDSVMCMLMLNVTHDTSYTYGNTMKVLVENSDIVTAVTLLIVAFLCTCVIPLIRCVTMGLLFYLGYFAVIRALFRDNREKVQVSCGYLASHVIYLVVNIAYLLAFKLMMAVTTSDEVLTATSMEINSGNPMWCLILIIIMSVLFIIASWKMIVFCIKNYKDMGMAAITGTVAMVGATVSGGFEKMMEKLTDSDTGSAGSADPSGAESNSKRKKKKSGADRDQSIEGSGSGRSGGTGDTGRNSDTSTSNTETDYDSQVFDDGTHDNTDPTEVDREIARGKKEAAKENRKKEKEAVKKDREQK